MNPIVSLFVCLCVSSTACTASLAEPPIDRQSFDIDACESTNIAGLANLSPGEAVDFMEIRENGWSAERAGSRCAGASDVGACEEAFGSLPRQPGWYARPGGGAPAPEVWLAYTRGDEVGGVGRDEIAAFLAPVDTVADAVFLAQIATLGTGECGANVRAIPGGFEVITQTSYVCGGGRDESRVEVLADGSTQIRERVVLDPGREEICP